MGTPEFSLALTEDQTELRDWVHGFARDVVRPVAAEWDARAILRGDGTDEDQKQLRQRCVKDADFIFHLRHAQSAEHALQQHRGKRDDSKPSQTSCLSDFENTKSDSADTRQCDPHKHRGGSHTHHSAGDE